MDQDSQASLQRYGLTRRHLLMATGATAAGVALGFNPLLAGPALAAPTSAAGVIALGRSYLGLRLDQVRPLTTAPWNSYPNADWCSWFISWILRGLGYGYHPGAPDWEGLLPHVTSPQVGDLVRIQYSDGSRVHIGLVTQVTPSIRILDGNRVREGRVAPSTTEVDEDVAYSGMYFLRPNYSGGPNGGTEVPTLFQTTQNVAQTLTVMSWADVEQFTGAQWPKIPYQGTTAFNIAEIVPSASIFDVALSLYVSNLPAGHHVGVRLALWDRQTDAMSGTASMTFEGDANGRARGNYSMSAQIVQAATRLCVQAYATAPNVSLDLWRCDGKAW